MFKQLFSALRGSESLDEAFAEFSQMLEHACWMFIRANDVLRREIDATDARESLYERDKAINALVRSIRRKIVRHLTINPGMDVAACLALMSVAKDAERIGDYCKNVFEVGQFYRQDFHIARYHEPLEEMRQEVEKLFSSVQEAFVNSDSSRAKEALAAARTARTRSDTIIEQLLRDDASIETHEAVAYSLLARHYKRVTAHLANIATAVGGRIEDLDFINA